MKVLIAFLLLTHITQSICPDGDTLCSRCGGDHCLLCMASYVSDNGMCLQVTDNNKKQQCLSYDNALGFCKMCNYGYYVNASNGCSAIENITRCLVYDRDTQECITCNGAVLPDEEGKCDKGEKCSIENCLVCRNLGNGEECLHCANNFTSMRKDDGTSTCVFQNSYTLNCRLAEFNNPRVCLECDINYYYSNGRCLRTTAVDIGINYSGKNSVGIFGVLMGVAVSAFVVG